MRKTTTLLVAALIAMPVSLLTACAPDTTQAAHSSSDEVAVPEVSLQEGWAKSAELGDMTGVFGTLTNNTDSDLVITGAESPDAEMIELHEVTADGVMQPIAGDVVVPAHGTFELAPGANHIMLMGLTKYLLAGEEVTVTLHFAASDGATSKAKFTVLVKDYAGANENYAGSVPEGESHDSHDSHASN